MLVLKNMDQIKTEDDLWKNVDEKKFKVIGIDVPPGDAKIPQIFRNLCTYSKTKYLTQTLREFALANIF